MSLFLSNKRSRGRKSSQQKHWNQRIFHALAWKLIKTVDEFPSLPHVPSWLAVHIEWPHIDKNKLSPPAVVTVHLYLQTQWAPAELFALTLYCVSVAFHSWARLSPLGSVPARGESVRAASLSVWSNLLFSHAQWASLVLLTAWPCFKSLTH